MEELKELSIDRRIAEIERFLDEQDKRLKPEEIERRDKIRKEKLKKSKEKLEKLTYELLKARGKSERWINNFFKESPEKQEEIEKEMTKKDFRKRGKSERWINNFLKKPPEEQTRYRKKQTKKIQEKIKKLKEKRQKKYDKESKKRMKEWEKEISKPVSEEEAKEKTKTFSFEESERGIKWFNYKGSDNAYGHLNISGDLKYYQLFKIGLKTLSPSNRYAELHLSVLDEESSPKMFTISDNQKFLIQNNIVEIRKLGSPYWKMFLDVDLVIHNRRYYGFLISDIDLMKQLVGKQYGINARLKGGIDILTFYEEKGEMIKYTTINFYKKDKDKYNNEIRNFVMNFVEFVNSDDVRFNFIEKTESNIERRLKKGKIPLPSFNKIYLYGFRKVYFKQLIKQKEKIESLNIRKGLSYAFTIRGHYKHFWNKKVFHILYEAYEKGEINKIGSKHYKEGREYVMDENRVLKLYVYPCIKGEGKLIDSRYELK